MSILESSTELVRYNHMRQAIVECRSVDEVKEIRDRARALEVYAAQALNYDSEKLAAEIRIRAERRAGDLLREMKLNGARHTGHGNQRAESNDPTPKTSTLAALGITKDQSSQWQKLAEIPAPLFEKIVTEPGIPHTETVITKANPNSYPPRDLIAEEINRVNPQAFDIGYALQTLVAKRSCDLSQIIPTMTPEQKTEWKLAIPLLLAWLENLTQELQK